MKVIQWNSLFNFLFQKFSKLIISFVVEKSEAAFFLSFLIGFHCFVGSMRNEKEVSSAGGCKLTFYFAYLFIYDCF